jgi:hypothetical protein
VGAPIKISTFQLERHKNQCPHTYPTQSEFANHTTPAAGSRAPVFDRRRPRVASKGVQLQLRLIAHLSGETLVASDVEVCAARDFVVGDALARFDVTQDADVRSGRHVAVAAMAFAGPFAVRYKFLRQRWARTQISHNSGFCRAYTRTSDIFFLIPSLHLYLLFSFGSWLETTGC